MHRRWWGVLLVVLAACSTTASNSSERAAAPVATTAVDVWTDGSATTVSQPPATTVVPTSTATSTSTAAPALPTMPPLPPTTTTTAVPLVDVDERTVEPADPAMPVTMRLPVAPARPVFDDLIRSWATVAESEFAARARTLIRDRQRAERERLAAEEAARQAAERAAAEAAAEAAEETPEGAEPPGTTAPPPTTATPPPPPPPPPPPTFTVDFDPLRVHDHHTVVRIRSATHLGDLPESTTTAFYALDDGRVVASSALISPESRSTVVDLVATAIGDAATDWSGVTADQVLVDVSFTDAGHVRIRVPTRLLVPGTDPAASVVVFDRDAMTHLLSPLGRALGDDEPALADVVSRPPASCARDRCVAITYDDGPTESTERVLDVLDNAGVDATFFVVGRLVEARPDLAARMAAAGHAIGNHTWTHPNLRSLDAATIADEVSRTDAVIRSATGIETDLLRPPYGRWDDEVRYTVDKGIAIWDVDTRDWQHRDPAVTVRAVMDQVDDGSVILLHDAFPTAADVTALLIAELRAAGYRLVTLPELLGEPEPGRVYYSQTSSEAPPPPTTTTTTTTTTTLRHPTGAPAAP